jgi:hypothetical protein
MGTAVLAEKPDVLLDKGIWSSKENFSKKENALKKLAHSLQLDGYDAVFVQEEYDENEILKYFDENGNVKTE